MKTLNQKELFLVWGGNSENEEVSVRMNEETTEVVVETTSFLQYAGAFLSRLALSCCS